jgi:hypothetical protein
MKNRVRTPLVFTGMLLFFVAAMLAVGLGYPYNVKIAPFAAGVPTLVLLIILLLGEWSPEWRIGGKREKEGEADSEDRDFASWGPVLNLLGWVFGFYAMLFLFGFMVATPVFLAGFLRRKAGVGWAGSVSCGVLCTLLSAYLVQVLFKIDLWLGAVPRLVPGFLGGSILPPF